MSKIFCRTRTEIVINIITGNVVKTFKRSFDGQINHQIETAYIHCSQVALMKLIFDHKIYTNLNHGTCLRANDYASENAIKKRHKY